MFLSFQCLKKLELVPNTSILGNFIEKCMISTSLEYLEAVTILGSHVAVMAWSSAVQQDFL